MDETTSPTQVDPGMKVIPTGVPQIVEMQTTLNQPARGLSDQEIRVRALECAVRLMEKGIAHDQLLRMAVEFEAYIRDGR